VATNYFALISDLSLFRPWIHFNLREQTELLQIMMLLVHSEQQKDTWTADVAVDRMKQVRRKHASIQLLIFNTKVS
jgi:hypothetical protein